MPSVSGFDEVKTQQTQKKMTENEITSNGRIKIRQMPEL